MLIMHENAYEALTPPPTTAIPAVPERGPSSCWGSQWESGRGRGRDGGGGGGELYEAMPL